MSIVVTRVVNLRKDDFDVYIGRPGTFGNPFIIGRDGNRDDVCDKHWEWLFGRLDAPDGRKPPTISAIKASCQGRRLGCFCAPKRCHGDNYVRICRGDYE